MKHFLVSSILSNFPILSRWKNVEGNNDPSVADAQINDYCSSLTFPKNGKRSETARVTSFRDALVDNTKVLASQVDGNNATPIQGCPLPHFCATARIGCLDRVVNMAANDGLALKWKLHSYNPPNKKFNSVRETANSMHIRNTGRRKSPENCAIRRTCGHSFNSYLMASHCSAHVSSKSRHCAHCNMKSRHLINVDPRCKEETQQQNLTWLYMIVWIVSVLPYINGLNGEFVHDDLSAVTSNPDVTGGNSLYQVFLNDYWGKPLSHPLSHKSYRPLTILTFR